jgi:hypothetical protein
MSPELSPFFMASETNFVLISYFVRGTCPVGITVLGFTTLAHARTHTHKYYNVQRFSGKFFLTVIPIQPAISYYIKEQT